MHWCTDCVCMCVCVCVNVSDRVWSKEQKQHTHLIDLTVPDVYLLREWRKRPRWLRVVSERGTKLRSRRETEGKNVTNHQLWPKTWRRNDGKSSCIRSRWMIVHLKSSLESALQDRQKTWYPNRHPFFFLSQEVLAACQQPPVHPLVVCVFGHPHTNH